MQATGGRQIYAANLTNAASGQLAWDDNAASHFFLDGTTKLEADEEFAGAGILRVRGTLDLQGHTLTEGGVFTSDQNPTVTNGRLAGTTAYRVESGKTLTLDSTVTMAADITVTNSGRLLVSNGKLILDDATVHLQAGGSWTPLDFVGDAPELAGNGRVSFEGSSGHNLVRPLTADSTLTIGAGITIAGPQSGVVGTEGSNRNTKLTNQGTLRAEGSGDVSLNTVSVRNEGRLQAGRRPRRRRRRKIRSVREEARFCAA